MLMVGALPCDSGNILINGIDLRKFSVKAKRQLAYLPDKNIIYPFLTGNEFLNFIKAVKKTTINAETKDLLAAFNLGPYMTMPFSEMSLGTQKKFLLIAATMGDPAVLILDEPTNALEQSSQDIFIEYLQRQAAHKILIMATHDAQLVANLQARKIHLEKHPISALR